MEQSKRQIKLLVAFIFGVGFLGFLGYGILDEYQAANLSFRFSQGFYWLLLVSVIIHIPAVLFNFFGWRKNDIKKTLVAAILYSVSLNIPSAVLCFFGFGQLKNIKGKLLFYTAACTLSFLLTLVLFLTFGPQQREGVTLTVSDFAFVIYPFVTIGAGIILNFFGWKKDSKMLILLAGILYILGVLSIVPAIICFVCYRRMSPGRKSEDNAPTPGPSST